MFGCLILMLLTKAVALKKIDLIETFYSTIMVGDGRELQVKGKGTVKLQIK